LLLKTKEDILKNMGNKKVDDFHINFPLTEKKNYINQLFGNQYSSKDLLLGSYRFEQHKRE